MWYVLDRNLFRIACFFLPVLVVVETAGIFLVVRLARSVILVCFVLGVDALACVVVSAVANGRSLKFGFCELNFLLSGSGGCWFS